MSHLLDTNVVSELRKRRPDQNVLAWFDATRGTDRFLSTLVVGELRKGIERLRSRDPAQAGAIDSWLAVVRREYADQIIPVTEEIAEEWGRMNAGTPLPVVDSLMAATAKVLDLTLVTRNTAGLDGTGVRLLNPWLPA